MKQTLLYNTHPSRGSARTVALMSLFFSLLACLLAGVALLVAVNHGELPRLPGARPAAEATPEPPHNAEAVAGAQWDQVRDRLRRAETLVASRDSHAQAYLDQLKTDMERLMRNAPESGKWMGDAVAKVKAIREQVAANGPEAARRLRELSSDLAEKVRTLYHAAETLQSILPRRQGAAVTPTPAAMAPEVPEVR